MRCFWVDIYFNSNRKTWVSLTPQGRDMMSPLLSAHHPLPFVDTTSLPPSRLVQAHGMKSPACRPPSADNSYLVYPSPVPAAPAPIPISPQIPLFGRFPHVQRRAKSTTPTPSPTTPVKRTFSCVSLRSKPSSSTTLSVSESLGHKRTLLGSMR